MTNIYAEPGELQALNHWPPTQEKILVDMVNAPPHYTTGKIECIDALDAATVGLMGIEAHCTANAIKYLWRWKRKNGAEDLKKSIWYINKLLSYADKSRFTGP